LEAINATKALTGDADAWFLVCLEFLPNNTCEQANNSICNFISECRKWKQLGPMYKDPISQAASQFLIVNAPKDHSLVATDSQDRIIWVARTHYQLLKVTN
jgi:hypothetical protein